jgi:hypothetical protein
MNRTWEDERRDVVAWLRAPAHAPDDGPLSDAIERGEHEGAAQVASPPKPNWHELRAALNQAYASPPETACTCGSGLHPRRCTIHPERYQKHCNEISAENEEPST